MKKQPLSASVAAYHRQLNQGEIQVAYEALVKYVMSLKTRLAKTLGDQFSVGGIFQGYMDYTYFYFADDACKARKLKFALVLNHPAMRFELWLLGQTKDVQARYWQALKQTEWVEGDAMPQYSIFEHTLVQSPNFDDLPALSASIEAGIAQTMPRILESLAQIKD